MADQVSHIERLMRAAAAALAVAEAKFAQASATQNDAHRRLQELQDAQLDWRFADLTQRSRIRELESATSAIMETARDFEEARRDLQRCRQRMDLLTKRRASLVRKRERSLQEKEILERAHLL